jgi:estrogen-related receptor beta like 1
MAEEEESKTPRSAPDEEGDPSVLMEEIVESLKLLNYEASFLSNKGFRPLNRTQFVVPASNPGEQFVYFTSLVAWLLQLNGSQTSFGKYDDPTTVASNIVVELKRLNIELDFAPGKLKAGHGFAPCSVILALSKRALKNSGFRFNKPKYPEEGLEAESENIEGDDDAIMVDDAVESDEELTTFTELQPSAGGRAGGEDETGEERHNAPIWSQIDPNEWRFESERVASKLKIVGDPTGGDSREWRSHLEQTKQFKFKIEHDMPDTELKIRKIADDMSKELERIGAQEKKINTTMGDIADGYRGQANSLNGAQNEYKVKNERVGELSQQLEEINQKLEEITGKIDKESRSVTDTTPLVGIKDALKQLKTENREMELRSAVLSHTLFQSKLKDKSKPKY